MSSRRTLWQEGRYPARLVVTLSVALTLLAVLADRALSARLGVLFDVAFVLVCLAAALAVRPRDFFAVGVLPPLLMLAVVVLLAVTARASVAEATDGPVQAVVSGLAHHAGGLVAGYALALAVLALRRIAEQRQGRLRRPRVTAGDEAPHPRRARVMS